MNWVDGSENRTVEVVGFEAHKTTSQYRPSLKRCSTQLFQRSCSQKKTIKLLDRKPLSTRSYEAHDRRYELYVIQALGVFKGLWTYPSILLYS